MEALRLSYHPGLPVPEQLLAQEQSESSNSSDVHVGRMSESGRGPLLEPPRPSGTAYEHLREVLLHKQQVTPQSSQDQHARSSQVLPSDDDVKETPDYHSIVRGIQDEMPSGNDLVGGLEAIQAMLASDPHEDIATAMGKAMRRKRKKPVKDNTLKPVRQAEGRTLKIQQPFV